jgi:hypothetical protein
MPWLAHLLMGISFICHNTKHCIAEGTLGYGVGGVSAGTSASFSARLVHTRNTQ